MKRAILFNAFLLLTATAIAVADGALDVSTGFFGGTVPNATTFASPVVFTGDNSGGTGTMRIRPADEDTAVTLCEASNNASPEVCSVITHQNNSSTGSITHILDNAYMDAAGTFTRVNSAFGAAQIRAGASTSNASTFVAQNVYSNNGTHSGDVALIVTGNGTATFSTGASTTVTNDFRGPILNGGSATCNGYNAGAECHADTIHVYNTSNALAYFQAGTTATASGIVMQDSASATAFGSSAYYGSAHADADYADKVVYAGFSKLISLVRADNVADATAAVEVRDNTSATGVLLMDVLGNGTVRPLLYGSQSNCSDGAGAAACSAAPVGGVVIDAAATTVVVSTTAVTANSRIMLQEDTSLALTGSPTCNTDAGRTYRVTARTAGTSFTITASAAPVTNPACLSYSIIN